MLNARIFRCRSCGARVAWKDERCQVCNRLVSNDRLKRRILIALAAGVLIPLLAMAYSVIVP